jgi:hypothetical protein
MSSSVKALVKLALSVIAFLMVLPPRVAEAQTNQATSPLPGAIPSPEWNWGMPTNGVCAEAGVHWQDDHGQLPEIDVRLVDTNPICIFGGNALADDLAGKYPPIEDLFDRNFHDKWLYFGPTNLVCGPIELRDAAGRQLPSLKPRISSPAAYPMSFSLAQARKQRPDRRSAFPPPLYEWAPQLAHFKLGDYFAINKPGAYRLTVWPKIYKRSIGNPDLCERIDVPPVAVVIDWTAPPAK